MVLDISRILNIAGLYDNMGNEHMNQNYNVAIGQQPSWVEDLPEKWRVVERILEMKVTAL